MLSLLATSVLAGPKCSVWKGKILFNSGQMPNPSDPNQQALIASGTAAQQQTSLKLILKGDNTYVLTTTVAGTVETTTGTWSQSGSAVTIQPVTSGVPGVARVFIAQNCRKLLYNQGPLTISFCR